MSVIAQALAEYGALQAIESGFMHAYNRAEVFLTTGNSRFILFAAIAAVVVLFLLRRR